MQTLEREYTLPAFSELHLTTSSSPHHITRLTLLDKADDDDDEDGHETSDIVDGGSSRTLTAQPRDDDEGDDIGGAHTRSALISHSGDAAADAADAAATAHHRHVTSSSPTPRPRADIDGTELQPRVPVRLPCGREVRVCTPTGCTLRVSAPPAVLQQCVATMGNALWLRSLLELHDHLELRRVHARAHAEVGPRVLFLSDAHDVGTSRYALLLAQYAVRLGYHPLLLDATADAAPRFALPSCVALYALQYTVDVEDDVAFVPALHACLSQSTRGAEPGVFVHVVAQLLAAAEERVARSDRCRVGGMFVDYGVVATSDIAEAERREEYAAAAASRGASGGGGMMTAAHTTRTHTTQHPLDTLLDVVALAEIDHIVVVRSAWLRGKIAQCIHERVLAAAATTTRTSAAAAAAAAAMTSSSAPLSSAPHEMVCASGQRVRLLLVDGVGHVTAQPPRPTRARQGWFAHLFGTPSSPLRPSLVRLRSSDVRLAVMGGGGAAAQRSLATLMPMADDDDDGGGGGGDNSNNSMAARTVTGNMHEDKQDDNEEEGDGGSSNNNSSPYVSSATRLQLPPPPVISFVTTADVPSLRGCIVGISTAVEWRVGHDKQLHRVPFAAYEECVRSGVVRGFALVESVTDEAMVLLVAGAHVLPPHMSAEANTSLSSLLYNSDCSDCSNSAAVTAHGTVTALLHTTTGVVTVYMCDAPHVHDVARMRVLPSSSLLFSSSCPCRTAQRRDQDNNDEHTRTRHVTATTTATTAVHNNNSDGGDANNAAAAATAAATLLTLCDAHAWREGLFAGRNAFAFAPPLVTAVAEDDEDNVTETAAAAAAAAVTHDDDSDDDDEESSPTRTRTATVAAVRRPRHRHCRRCRCRRVPAELWCLLELRTTTTTAAAASAATARARLRATVRHALYSGSLRGHNSGVVRTSSHSSDDDAGALLLRNASCLVRLVIARPAAAHVTHTPAAVAVYTNAPCSTTTTRTTTATAAPHACVRALRTESSSGAVASHAMLPHSRRQQRLVAAAATAVSHHTADAHMPGVQMCVQRRRVRCAHVAVTRSTCAATTKAATHATRRAMPLDMCLLLRCLSHDVAATRAAHVVDDTA